MEAAAAVVLMLKGFGFGACKHSARGCVQGIPLSGCACMERDTEKERERESDSDIYICTYIYIGIHMLCHMSL